MSSQTNTISALRVPADKSGIHLLPVEVKTRPGAGHCGEQASAQPHSHHRATQLETCLERFVLCWKIVEQHIQMFLSEVSLRMCSQLCCAICRDFGEEVEPEGLFDL